MLDRRCKHRERKKVSSEVKEQVRVVPVTTLALAVSVVERRNVKPLPLTSQDLKVKPQLLFH